MLSQLTRKQRIPSFILLFLSLIFIFMALGKSQYQLFSDLFRIVGETPFSKEHYAYTLGGIFTIFVVLLLVFILLLDIVTFFFDRLFNYHTVHKMLFGLVVLETVSEIVSFAMVFMTKDLDPTFFSAFNWIDLILNLLVSVSYFVTEILFISKPYHELKRQVEKEEETKEKNKPLFQAEKEEIKDEKKAVVTNNSKSEMLKMVTTLLDQKKITKEEADKMIERITDDD